jgi:hypothetical protein
MQQRHFDVIERERNQTSLAVHIALTGELDWLLIEGPENIKS